MVDGVTDDALTKVRFERDLPNGFVPALNEAYGDEDGWWRKLADDKDVFIAIRGGTLNAYYKGNSLLQIDLKKGRLVGRVHYKYLLRPEMKSEYIPVVNGIPQFGREHSDFFTSNLNDVPALKKAADAYAGTEKTGVHCILKANANIIDVEAAFGGVSVRRKDRKPGQLESKKSAPRVDFVALQDRDDEVHLVFFEAKNFSNSELVASGSKIPEVVDQIQLYRDLLIVKRSEVETAYRNVFERLLAMDGHGIRKQARDTLMAAVLDGRKRLVVDPNPRLVVFGFDDAQRKGTAWSEQERKLRGALAPGTLLMCGDPKKFTNGISTNLGKPR